VCACVIASNEVAKQSLGYVGGDCFADARNDGGDIARNDRGVQVFASNGVAKQSLGYVGGDCFASLAMTVCARVSLRATKLRSNL